jgi:hypothetical protein
MVRAASKDFKANLEPVIELLGVEEVLRQVGYERVVEQLGPERVVEQLGPERLLELLQLKKVVEDKGLDWLLAQLTPVQRRELKRRLQ